MIPNGTPAKWKSTKALSDARSILPNEMGLYLQQDNVKVLLTKQDDNVNKTMLTKQNNEEVFKQQNLYFRL